MRTVTFLFVTLVLISMPFLVLFSDGSFIDYLIQQLTSPPSPFWGMWSSIVYGYAIFVWVYITQGRNTKYRIRKYRAAEEQLIKLGKIEKGQILNYHASFNWQSYASVSISTLFIILSVIYAQVFSKQTDFSEVFSKEESIFVLASLLLLFLSAIILAFVDLWHDNTLSPLIPSKRRFRIANFIIMTGSLAIISQIVAIGIFVSIFNSWIAIAGGTVAFILVLANSVVRGIPMNELKEEFELTDKECNDLRGS